MDALADLDASACQVSAKNIEPCVVIRPGHK